MISLSTPGLNPPFGPAHQSMVWMTAMMDLALGKTVIGIEATMSYEFVEICLGNAPFGPSRDLVRVRE